jgi:hypothetical protein
MLAVFTTKYGSQHALILGVRLAKVEAGHTRRVSAIQRKT